MSCKKMLLLLIAIIAIAVGVNYFLQQESVDNPVDGPVPVGEMMVGNDRDEHGCIGSAGYVWCGSKAECLRPWEEVWDDSCNTADFSYDKTLVPVGDVDKNSVACTAEAKICADGSNVVRSGPNCEFEKCPEELLQ
jgi:hypothetical protein